MENGEKKFKSYYYVETAIGYAIRNTFKELEETIRILSEKKFEITSIHLIVEEK